MSNSRVFGFERLVVWNQIRALIKEMYVLTEKFPSSERFGLISQIRRASVSVGANIAEGSSRRGLKNQANFYNISFSSLMELISLLVVSYDLGYIDFNDLKNLRRTINHISFMINKLYESTMNPP